MTAVEWLEKRLNIYFNKKMNSSLWKIQEYFERAKQMEKEQIIDAFNTGCDDEIRLGKQYYNDMYLFQLNQSKSHLPKKTSRNA